jgi:LmbE family N-acetylglucosaminyl deacetylase/tetratricopeptide (TPR) repeat protein
VTPAVAIAAAIVGTATVGGDPLAQLKQEARLAAGRGALLEACTRLEEVVREAPRDFDARLRLADTYAVLRDLDHSIAAYRDLLDLDPANRRAKVGLARVLRWSHRSKDAEILYKEILADAPEDAEAIEGLARTYAVAGDFPNAVALIDRGLGLSRGNAQLHAFKGTVLAWQGRLDEALVCLEHALRLRPQAPDILHDLGDVLMWKGDAEGAARAYRQVREIEPGDVGTALDLARAYERSGNVALAEDAVLDALRLAPDDRGALERLQELRRGRRFDAARWSETGIEATTHAWLPLAVAVVFYRRRRRFARRQTRLSGLAYQTLLPALGIAWIAAFAAVWQSGNPLLLHLVEALVFVAVALALPVRSPEARPPAHLNASVVLAVGAHPDDIEFGAGGLLARLKQEGTRVYGLVMSQGERGTPGRNRRPDEAREGARVLGLDGMWILDFPDTRLRERIPDMRDAVAARLEELDVDLVITHSFREVHGDHVAVFEATKEAARRCSMMCFETVSTPPEFVPNYFADVTAFVERKLQAIAAHRSQGDKGYMNPELVLGRAAHRGLQVNVPYAEAFWVYRWVR